ncbi:MAG: IS21 family transposase, partial [Spirochaetota bacterium]
NGQKNRLKYPQKSRVMTSKNPCRVRAARRREMLQMNQIDQIKELQRQGLGAKAIAAQMRIDRKTVAKYMAQEDFTSACVVPLPVVSKLDPWKPQIDQWLEEDRRRRYKQRHPARRIHQRLTEEQGEAYTCSYPLVQRYVQAKKTQSGKEQGYLELVWNPGEAQADFGEADIVEHGKRTVIKYLCLSFPYSNAAYIQVFRGENAECACQGLKDIFHRIGGVPERIVFDNASGVGRRIRDKISLADVFLRFKCHYGFSVSFCNPGSGHEKGNVENKVGYVRRNFFVPMPAIEDLETWNRDLLVEVEADFQRRHYKKGLPISELFGEDRKRLSPLPAKPFPVERFERLRTDGYGKFCLEGKHWYSSAPEQAYTEVVVGVKAHHVWVYEKNSGGLIVEHPRSYGSERTDRSDYRTALKRLMKHPGAWKNSQVRVGLSARLREGLDGLADSDLRGVLRVLSFSSASFGYEVALASLEEALRLGAVDKYSVGAIAARIRFDGLNVVPEKGPDLKRYDTVLIPKENER